VLVQFVPQLFVGCCFFLLTNFAQGNKRTKKEIGKRIRTRKRGKNEMNRRFRVPEVTAIRTHQL